MEVVEVVVSRDLNDLEVNESAVELELYLVSGLVD